MNIYIRPTQERIDTIFDDYDEYTKEKNPFDELGEEPSWKQVYNTIREQSIFLQIILFSALPFIAILAAFIKIYIVFSKITK